MNQQSLSTSQSSCGETCDVAAKVRPAKPEYRVERRDEGVTLLIALPGVRKEDSTISVVDRVLTVGAKRADSVPEAWKTHHAVPQPTEYSLVVRLHPDLDPSSIAAELKDGVLTVAIEQLEAAKPRTVEVN